MADITIYTCTEEEFRSLKAHIAQLRAELAETKAALEEMTEKWQRACDAAAHQELLKMQAEGPKLEQLARKAEELTELLRSSLCKACDAARAELRTLTEAWALRELELFEQAHPSILRNRWVSELPPRIAEMFRAGAGKCVGACDLCGKRVPLERGLDTTRESTGFVAALRVCCPGWGCSAEKGVSDAKADSSRG
jgi:hypothetical protein